MRIHTRTAWLQKAGNAEEEYEDASWPRRPHCLEVPIFRAAVADGATETSFARDWAQLLVGAWSRGRLWEERLWRGLPELQRRWLDSVRVASLPWYAQEKLRFGAYSSLLGLTMWDESGDEDRVQFRATAVGDSCLFHVRHNRLIAAFPLDNSRSFTSAPRLLSTRSDANRELHPHSLCGTCRSGDVLYLMTDALAHWFLNVCEGGGVPWLALNGALQSPSDFQDWIETLRRGVPSMTDTDDSHGVRGSSRACRLRNDDVTVISLTIT